MPTRKPFHDSSRRVLDVQELAVRIAQGVEERGRNEGLYWEGKHIVVATLLH